MSPEHYIQDLDELIKEAQARRASMLEACRAGVLLMSSGDVWVKRPAA